MYSSTIVGLYTLMYNNYFYSVLEAIDEVNTSLDCDDSLALLQALQSQHAGLTNVQDSNSLHYLTVLRSLKAAKIEVKICMLLIYGI